MSDVYANGMEISAKKDANKSLCAMPDVCLSPPSPPAGPVPIPYPNTATASDTSGGSKTVKIGGNEVGLKNKSDYKSSKGDEAATRSLGMGVVTHTIQGKMKHAAWSMDVKIEGNNVIRHMDLTTHNHINQPNMAVTLNNAGMAVPVEQELTCKELDRLGNPGPDSVAEKELEEGMVLEGQTMALASYKPPGGPGNLLMKGVSHPDDMLDDAFANGWSKGKKWKEGGDNSRACGKGGSYNPASCGHAEARIIEEIFSAAERAGIGKAAAPGGLGNLTLNIEWNPGGGGTFQEPCGGCQNLICEAKGCGLDIRICANGEPKDPPCENGQWTDKKPPGQWAGPRAPRPTTAF